MAIAWRPHKLPGDASRYSFPDGAFRHGQLAGQQYLLNEHLLDEGAEARIQRGGFGRHVGGVAG